jgi:hypothetical protein
VLIKAIDGQEAIDSSNRRTCTLLSMSSEPAMTMLVKEDVASVPVEPTR